ncbi:MAG: phosphodiester glycosidase family protein [Anaerolineae bacterium]|nr:phosphodiester glycosidase family protein [Anaerolineae bacterium]
MLKKLVINIDKYTKGIDPISLHAAEVSLVITGVDNLFVQNARILANSGMPVAAYHWIDPTKDADKQVARTLEIINSSGLPIRAIFLGFEVQSISWDDWVGRIRALVVSQIVRLFSGKRLSSHAKDVFEDFRDSGYQIIGYTSASFMKKFAPQAQGWMLEYRWWLADKIDYGVHSLGWNELRWRILSSVNFFPALPAGINKNQVVGHQFSSNELSLTGLYGNIQRTKHSPVDLNLFNAQFLRDISAVPRQKPLPEVQYEAVVTAFPIMRVRSGPGAAYKTIYRLKNGAALEITDIRDGWAKIRSYAEAWCNLGHLEFVTAGTPIIQDNKSVDINQALGVDIDGVGYLPVRRFKANCHILIINPKDAKFHVTPHQSARTVSRVAKKLGAQIVVNGDGWGINRRFPNSIAASDGSSYQRNQLHFRPWVNFSLTNNISFAWRNPFNLYNALSGDRYLIQNGKYNEAIKNVTKDPRTAIGVLPDDKLILIVADGRTDQSAGLSFRELATLFLELGSTTAINLDGGGSSAMWIKDRIVNVPIDKGKLGQERPVANHLCIFIP